MFGGAKFTLFLFFLKVEGYTSSSVNDTMCLNSFRFTQAYSKESLYLS